MCRYSMCLVLFLGSFSVFAADKQLIQGLSNLTASLNDLAKHLPKKAGGGEEEPKKRSYAEVKDAAMAFLVSRADKGEKFASEGVILQELNARKLNPRDPALVDQATMQQKDKDEFEEALQVMVLPPEGAKRKAWLFEEALPGKLASVVERIRSDIRNDPAGAAPFGTVADIRQKFANDIDKVLPADASSLQRITAVDDYLRIYEGLDKAGLLEMEKEEKKLKFKPPMPKVLTDEDKAKIATLVQALKDSKKKFADTDKAKAYLKAEGLFTPAGWPGYAVNALNEAIENFLDGWEE